MKNPKLRRAGSLIVVIAIILSMCLSIVPPIALADSWPNETASAEPTFAGYRVKDVANWSPETDPYAEFMRASVPLQNRNEAFAATQAKPYLKSEAQVMLMQGDYGNSFFGSTMYTNEFSEHCLNFWQYTDYFSPWHGAATAYTPDSLYDPVTSDWRARGFEFGIVNIPNPAYTNAAHKNGVLSIACIYFDPAFRPGQTCADMIEKDGEGNFPVADQLIAMAEYFGYDGYFLNQEEGMYEDFKPFMAYLTSKGLWTQWYDTNSSFNSSKSAWLKDETHGQIHNSVFVNYGWSSSTVDSAISHAQSIGVDPFESVFFGAECNQNKFSGGHSSASNIPSNLYDATGNPRASIALFTPSDFYQRGLEELNTSSDGDPRPSMQKDGYQWMVAERERMFFSGVYTNPTHTGKAPGYSRPDVLVNSASGWCGVADFISERSVISGTTFYSNFNTGHGMQYFKNGSVSKDEEWTNINIQDILPTWQWWIDSTDSTKLSADFDYGSALVNMTVNKVEKEMPYTQVGAYDGGSSLVLYGELSGTDSMHLFKTDLAVNANSKASLTFKKTSSDNAAMKLGLIFKDDPENKVVLDIDGTTAAGNWTTSTVDLSAYAGKSIAAITLEFEGTASNYQMNVGGLQITDGSYKPEKPTGLSVDYAYADGQMIVSWNRESYDTVKQYNLYGVMSDNSRVYLGGIYGDILYVKSTFDENQSVRLELCAVGKDGTESDPATLTYRYDDKVSNVTVAEAATPSGLLTEAAEAGKLSVSFNAPATGAPDRYEFEVTLRNVASSDPDNKVYTATADGSATSAEIPLPIRERREYDLKIYAVRDGVRGEAICYRGYSHDSYSEPIAAEDIRISGSSVRLVDPDSVDWYKMTATFDGSQVASFKRGASSGRQMSFSLSNTTGLLSVVVEDFSGNTSEPTVLQLENGVPVDPTDLITAEHFPDPALLSAVRSQVGVTLSTLTEFTGTLDLTGTAVSDLTGITRLTGLTGINFTNCSALEEISGLAECAALKELNISGCTALKKLDVDGLGLEKLTGNGTFNQLTYVDISNNKLDLSEGTPERKFLDTALATAAGVQEPELTLGDNLVPGATVVTSSNIADAAKFVDGDSASDTYASNRSNPASITLDLGEQKQLGGFGIWLKVNDEDPPRPFGNKAAKLEVSDSADGEFTEVGSLVTVPGTTTLEFTETKATFAEPVSARYVRITVTEWWPQKNSTTADWPAMYEATVYEAVMVNAGGSQPDSEAGVNLLPGATVVSSDNIADVSKFVDGSTDTDTYASNRNKEASVVLDLGESKAIGSFSVWCKMNADASPRPFGIKSAKLEVSDSSDSGFVEVGTTTIVASTTANELLEAKCELSETATGRYVRITVTEWWPHPSGGNDWPAMIETAVYSGSTGPVVKFDNQRPVAYSAVYNITESIVRDVAVGETLDMADYLNMSVTIRGNSYLTLDQQLINGKKFIADDLDLSVVPSENLSIAIVDQNLNAIEGSVIDLGFDATWTVRYKNEANEIVATLTVVVGDGGERTIPEVITHDPTILYATSVEGQSDRELPANAFDEDDTTKWCPGGDAVQSQMIIDVHHYYTLTQWDMVHAGGSEGASRNTRDFELQVLKVKNPTQEQLADEAWLTDDANWTTVKAYVDNTENTTSYTFTEPIVARYFRLNVTKGDASAMWPSTRIYEWSMQGILAADPVVDKDDLAALVATAEGCTEADYTPASWSGLQTALESARTVLNNPDATQEEIAAAVSTLQTAIDALVERADTAALSALIAQAEALKAEDYTPETWAGLEAPLTAAKAIVADLNAAQADVDAAKTNLQAAIDGLVEVTKVNKSDLKLLLDTYPQLASMEKLFTRDSWAVWVASYEAAKPVYDDPNATQEEVDAAVARMQDAWNSQVARVTDENLATLQGLIAQAEALKESDYASGWEALQTALTAAKAIVADPGNAPNDDADLAITKLRSAIDGLVEVSVDKTALKEQIAGVDANIEAGAENSYTAASWKALTDALEAARTVLQNANATQEQVDAAKASLQSAIDALVEAGDATELKAMLEAAGKLDLDVVTEESAQAIRTAMENAQKAIDARDTQAALDAAAAALDAAVKNAEQKPVDPTDPDPTDPQPTDPQPTQPVDPDTPNTGDRMEIMLPLLAVVALGAMAAIVLLLKKRRTV